jgi:hypothetical protein
MHISIVTNVLTIESGAFLNAAHDSYSSVQSGLVSTAAGVVVSADARTSTPARLDVEHRDTILTRLQGAALVNARCAIVGCPRCNILHF